MTQCRGQGVGAFLRHARGDNAKGGTRDPCCIAVVDILDLGLDDLGSPSQQGIATGIAGNLVDALKVLQLQHQQGSVAYQLLRLYQGRGNAVEIAPVSDPCHRVHVNLLAQCLGERRLFIEDLVDLAGQAVHGNDHAAQFPCARQSSLDRVAAPADGISLALDFPERAQHDARGGHAEQQDDDAGSQVQLQCVRGTSPQAQVRRPRVGSDMQCAGLFPSRHHHGLCCRRFQGHEPYEPLRDMARVCGGRSFDQDLSASRQHPYVQEIAAVKDRADHGF